MKSFFENENLKLPVNLEEAMNMENPEFFKRREPAEKTGHIRATVIFKKIPENFNEGMVVTLRVGRVLKDAILIPGKCKSDEVLYEGRLYGFSLAVEGRKTYITDYFRDKSVFPGPPFALSAGIEEYSREVRECLAFSSEGPKARVEITGQPYNLDFNDSGLKFVICNDEAAYRDCFVPDPLVDSVGYIEAGAKYRFKGIISSKGLCIYSVTETVEYEKIMGTAIFKKFPDPDEEEFTFTIDTGNGEIEAVIDRYSLNRESEIIFEEGEEYEFSYPEGEEYRISGFEKLSGSLPPPGNMDAILEDVDKKIFSLECHNIEKPEAGKYYADIVLEFSGKPSCIKKSASGITSFSVEVQGIKYNCFFDEEMSGVKNGCEINEETDYIFEAFLVGETAYVRGIYKMSPDFQEENQELLRAVSKLSESRRDEAEYIIKNGKKYGKAGEKRIPAFRSRVDMTEKYKLLKEYYPREVQTVVDKLLSSDSARSAHKDKILDCMINTPWGITPEITGDYGFLKEKLDEKFYGQEQLKETIIKIILSYMNKKDKKGGAILLVGPPGVGKTSMMRYAAKAAGIPFGKISLNGVDTPYFINGTPRLYENATMGQIMETVRVCGDNSIIMLDEVDKMGHGREGDPMTGLYNLLDANELFRDNLIEDGIDLSNVIFVLTANDTGVIPAPVLDRVSEIYVSGYTDEEKNIIARDYVIKAEMEKYEHSGKKIIWTDDAVCGIANKYTLTNGVRDIEKNAAAVIRNVFHIMEKNGEEELTVSAENLEELMDIIPCSRDEKTYDIAGLKNKFRYFRYSYPEKAREAISGLFSEFESCRNRDDGEIIRKKLEYAVNYVPEKGEVQTELPEVKKRLDRSHFGMDEVKSAILSYIAARRVNPDSCAKCLWLDGPCGTGKTTVCKTVAEAMGRKFIKVSLNGVTSPGFIKGFESTWKDAAAGKIAEALALAGTDRVVILLDEIDKMTAGGNGDPAGALLDLLDDSAEFTDLFVSVPYDVSDILFIATSNNAADVPVALRDRMELISLNGYTSDEKKQIAREFVTKKKLNEYRLNREILSDAIINDTVSGYCKAYGIRDVDKTFDKVLREFVKESQLGCAPKEIDGAFIRRVLGARPLKRGNVSEKTRPGIARALAVSGNAGTTFAVQVTGNPYGEEDEITGLAKQSVVESVKLSKLLLGKILKRKLPNLHIHFGEGGIEKEGPSAGITVFSAMYSCLTGIEISNKTGMTGEIDAFGDVWPIGGLELKITAAENEGCDRVFVPAENYRQLAESDSLDKYRCEIIPVSNVEEICRLLEEKGDQL